jgi:hypothetical protein
VLRAALQTDVEGEVRKLYRAMKAGFPRICAALPAATP